MVYRIATRQHPRVAVKSTEECEPDYRFTLANERTFLAWIRTSLALLGGGIALTQFVPHFSVPAARQVLSALLVAAGGSLAALAVQRWRRTQRAMRQGADLPASRLPLVLGIALAAVAVLLVVLLVLTPADGAV